MKKKTYFNSRITALVLVLILLCSLCVCCIFAACGDKDDKDGYVARYKLQDCSLDINEVNNTLNEVAFDKKYSIGETVVYFDTEINSAEICDKWIDRISKYSEILNQNDFAGVNSVYISNKLIANYSIEENAISVSFKSETAEEEAFAWILQAVSGNDGLPHGVFAGIAVRWLEISEYSDFIYSSIASAGYLTELQFPIYETDNLPENEKKYAWSFSNFLVKELMQSGKTEKQIMAMNTDELNSFLQENFKISLPDYTFFQYSTKYEYKIKQGYFTYYINKEFNDLVLPKSCFTTAYNFLSDWLYDNDKTTKASNALFGIGSTYDLEIFLDDGLKSYGITGEANSNYVILYSVGSFSHECIHRILGLRGKGGYMREVFCELHANTSKYANLMFYYLVSGSADNYPYADSVNEKQTYEETMKLYNRLSGFEASPENFDYWLFADCFSALYTNTGEKWISRLQENSAAYYVARVYGGELLWELNMNANTLFDGKTYLEVIEEWIDYLQEFKEDKNEKENLF